MKIFFDTNVLLSATTFPGLCDELLVQCMNSHAVLTSALVRAEGHVVLARKFPRLTGAPTVFDSVWKEATLIEDVSSPADDNDARLVAAAVAAGAELFVTGDRRVLEWGVSGAMRIVAPREAWVVLFQSLQDTIKTPPSD